MSNNSFGENMFRRTSYQPWWMSLLRGVVLFLFGLFAVIRPTQTIIILARLLGVYFLVDGLFVIFRSVANKKHDIKWQSTFIRGIIAVVIGLVVVIIPAFTAAVMGIFFMYLLAALSLFHGVMEILKAVTAKEETRNEWALIFSGAFFIVLAVLLFIAPLGFGRVLIRIIGIVSILAGGGLLITAFRNRSLLHK